MPPLAPPRTVTPSRTPQPLTGAFSWNLLPGWRWAAAAGAVAVLAACSRAEPPQEPIRAVKLLTVGASPLSTQFEYAGDVRARIESRVGFRVAGKIVQRQAELGQRVQAGQVLAQIDPRDYQLSADAARAQVASAQTQRDLAAADYQRFSALKAQNFISGAELDRRSATLKAADASLDQARAQLASQGNQATYTRLVADTAGVVTGIDAEPGQVVAAGAPVVRIAQDGPRDVVFSVPEDKVSRMRAGQTVSVRTWSGGEALPGRVREVAASADPVTRTFLVKVAIDSETPPPLGSTAYVIPASAGSEAPQAIKLPTSALRQEGQQTAVWVYDAASGTVRSQAIQVARADGNEAVVGAGLSPGMQVVAAGVHVLSPGQKVQVYQPKQPDAAANTGNIATNNIAKPVTSGPTSTVSAPTR
ncbi:efflux RND transporter periplasmic adaptor subunit [Acidovorax sp. GBBC 3334]|uniref:efflux RND transporter periplasmic adaptor subunit n=1 Tax=Acidovorax sp. GBBC 3334 TaxID=2940496 RepID=UPI0023041D3A|nr:efflux RND transporter periplasmic adaptor subunit [Acidovorax sp. GBBC 3334]MDA8454119.1 efflux RND transporter periplasmic adaptor subunit [Acidovorax sp. GBBC 3334]